MGNQPSSGDHHGSSGSGSGSGSRSGGRFLRSTGALGLSKAELDERCKPSGLYPSCNWEDKALRKLIGDGKLAARCRGTENRTSPTDRECPICFLQYREINMTKCCSAYICTECYLQVRPQKAKNSTCCPFCNHSKFSVTVAQAMNAEAMLAREETEQRFIEAKIRERAETAAAEKAATAADNNANANNNNNNNNNNGFGSSLQNDERIATLRARSSSLSDHESAEAMIPEDVLRESFAMTPEERRMLEDEMRAQHSHPLSLRLEAEAQERRLRNEQEFLRQNPTHHASILQEYASATSRGGRSSRGGGGGGGYRGFGRGSERRNWNQIVEAFERGGHGEVNSLDDLVVLEAAMILSMEEESRRRNNGTGGGAGEEFDANRHANEGFPLVRSILSGRDGGIGSAEQNEQLQLLANSLNSRRRSRNSLMRAYGGGGAADNINMESAMDTAGLLMRGISEDDQVAMAIAASLQDQQQQSSEEQQEEGQQSQEGEEGQQNAADNNNINNTDSASGNNDDEEEQVEENTAAGADSDATNNAEEQSDAPPAAAGAATSETTATREGEATSEETTATAEGTETTAQATAESSSAGEAAASTEESSAVATEGGGGAAVPDSLDLTNHGEDALN